MALDLNDKSGNNNTLTNVGADEVADGGFAASTVCADLELTDGDYLWAADSPSLSITGDITLELWIKLEQLPSTATIAFQLVGKYTFTGNLRSYTFQLLNTDKGSVSYSGDGTNTTNIRTDAAIVVAGDVGAWVHLAVAIDVSAKTAVFYKNGSPVASSYLSGTQTAIQDNASNFEIGAVNTSGTPANFFDGKIDEVRLWNDIRTEQEISDNKAIELTGNEDNLVAYWPFEAGPAGVKTINALAIASVKTINDVVITSVKTINDSA